MNMDHLPGIESVRIAAHDLENACRAFVGGIASSLGISYDVDTGPIDDLDKGVTELAETYRQAGQEEAQ